MLELSIPALYLSGRVAALVNWYKYVEPTALIGEFLVDSLCNACWEKGKCVCMNVSGVVVVPVCAQASITRML